MKALIATAPNRLEIQEIPQPELGPYDALVRMESCGVWNSTAPKHGPGTQTWAPPFPFILGHESAGTVVEVGPKVRRFKVGDRVTRPLAFWPGAREEVRVGKGGFAEFGMVRDGFAMADDGDASLLNNYDVQRQLVVPAGMSAQDAALAISLSETASVLRYLPNLAGKKVLVAGTGAVGLSFGLWAKMAGGFVVTLGRRAERLAKAAALGADAVVDTREPDFAQAVLDAAGGPLDGAIEASGDAALAGTVLGLLREGAFASAYGVPPKGIGYPAGWTVSRVEEQLSFAWVADLLHRGWVKPEWFVSHTWGWGGILDAYAQVERGEVLKGFVDLTLE